MACAVIQPDSWITQAKIDGKPISIDSPLIFPFEKQTYEIDELAFPFIHESFVNDTTLLTSKQAKLFTLKLAFYPFVPNQLQTRPAAVFNNQWQQTVLTAGYKSLFLPACDRRTQTAYMETPSGNTVGVVSEIRGYFFRSQAEAGGLSYTYETYNSFTLGPGADDTRLQVDDSSEGICHFVQTQHRASSASATITAIGASK
jgi:hypothetical protein